MAHNTETPCSEQDTPLQLAFECLQQLAANDLVAVPIEPSAKMVETATRVCSVDARTCKAIYEQMLLAADDSLIVYSEPE